jgi:hypothetical protein
MQYNSLTALGLGASAFSLCRNHILVVITVQYSTVHPFIYFVDLALLVQNLSRCSAIGLTQIFGFADYRMELDSTHDA